MQLIPVWHTSNADCSPRCSPISLLCSIQITVILCISLAIVEVWTQNQHWHSPYSLSVILFISRGLQHDIYFNMEMNSDRAELDPYSMYALGSIRQSEKRLKGIRYFHIVAPSALIKKRIRRQIVRTGASVSCRPDFVHLCSHGWNHTHTHTHTQAAHTPVVMCLVPASCFG